MSCGGMASPVSLLPSLGHLAHLGFACRGGGSLWWWILREFGKGVLANARPSTQSVAAGLEQVGLTWELVRNTESQVHSRPSESQSAL